jgi:threonine aldolase
LPVRIRVDLRSDTVSKPTPEMRRAMYEAEVGDDVYGDDPTVNRLQEKAAGMLGKEAGLFVSSGTQSNLVSVLSQATRGDEIVLGDKSHIFNSEAGGVSVLGGVVMYPVKTQPDGTFDVDDISSAVKPRDYHKPKTVLLCLENTHNLTGGRAVTPEATRKMAEAGRKKGLRVHLDGARLFNAAVALECPVKELTKPVDTVGFCLSKSLCCPVGSVLCGDGDFISEAKRWRKMLGGGMRQVGIVAAAGIVALDTVVDRLADDHANARKLAQGLSGIKGVKLDPATVQTNIVRFGVPKGTGRKIAGLLKEEGVHINPGDSDLRMVTYQGVSSADIDFTLRAMRRVMAMVNKSTG